MRPPARRRGGETRSAPRIQAHGRLIKNEHLGVVNQCRREEDPTLLTARQSTDGLVGELTDVQIGHDALAPVPDLRGRYSIHARTEGEKVFDRPRR